MGVRTRACVLVCLCIAFCSRDRASPPRERKAGRVMRVMRARIRSMCPQSCMRQRRRECICVSVCARISEFECMSMHVYTCVCTHTRTRKQRERCTAAYICYMHTHTKQGVRHTHIANVAFRHLTRIHIYKLGHASTGPRPAPCLSPQHPHPPPAARAPRQRARARRHSAGTSSGLSAERMRSGVTQGAQGRARDAGGACAHSQHVPSIMHAPT